MLIARAVEGFGCRSSPQARLKTSPTICSYNLHPYRPKLQRITEISTFTTSASEHVPIGYVSDGFRIQLPSASTPSLTLLHSRYRIHTHAHMCIYTFKSSTRASTVHFLYRNSPLNTIHYIRILASGPGSFCMQPASPSVSCRISIMQEQRLPAHEIFTEKVYCIGICLYSTCLWDCAMLCIEKCASRFWSEAAALDAQLLCNRQVRATVYYKVIGALPAI